jgi:hypothetical protein
MAFIRSGSTIISFAEYQDVYDTDPTLFDENEGLTDDVVENALIRSTERILSQLKNTVWYRTLALQNGASVLTIPALNASKIISRANDFTDLCVYYSLYQYILPKVADFGLMHAGSESNEKAKIGFYHEKFTTLFDELLFNSDWYDYDNGGTIGVKEYKPMPTNYVRIR